MGSRVLLFTNHVHLSINRKQLCVSWKDREVQDHIVAIEDVGSIILENPSITLSTAVVERAAELNIALVFCNSQRMPIALNLPLDGHHLQTERFSKQIQMTKKLKDNLWQTIIKKKVLNQATVLQSFDLPAKKLEIWAGKVLPGDPEGIESRAAFYYFQSLFPDKTFRRERGGAPPNNYLNYGYAVVRAAVARSLVGSGLLPSLSLHHRNKYNAYVLADDMIEPFRPFVDKVVLELGNTLEDWNEELSKEDKKAILSILSRNCKWPNKSWSPMTTCVQKSCQLLYKSIVEKKDELIFPIECD